MVRYAYNKLNAQRREIRLCTLFPGSFDDPVACDLDIVSLDDRPEYESLSYAWGSPILNQELLVKDRIDSSSRDSRPHKCDDDTTAGSRPAPALILTVTTNLNTAFRYLRKSDQMRVVRTFQRCHYFVTTFWSLTTILEKRLSTSYPS